MNPEQVNKNMDMEPKERQTGHQRIFIGIVLAIILGVLTGGFFPEFAVSLAFIGDLFLNSLMMIVVPLVIFSMIVGITGLGDIRNLGSIGWRTVLYYLATTCFSVTIGLFLVNVISPGKAISPGEEHPDAPYTIEGNQKRTVQLAPNQLQRFSYSSRYLILLLDQNVQGIIKTTRNDTIVVDHWQDRDSKDALTIRTEQGTSLPIRRQGGYLLSDEPSLSDSGKGFLIKLASVERLRGKEERDALGTMKEVFVGDHKNNKEGLIPRNIFNAMVNMDILPLIFFSLLIGAALSVLEPKARTTIEIITVLNDAIMRIVQWIMIVSPIGIFGLITARIGIAGGFSGFLPELVALGLYALTVLVGLAIHAFIILPLILYLLAHRNPLHFAAGVGTALLNAFSTASSSATLPLTMEGIEKRNGISNRTASFVLPLGATINMDGTALYEAVAAIFIAQVYGIHMGLAQQTIIFLTATLAAIGAAGIPEAGLVTMVIVLKAVDLPIEGIGLILSIDWLLDRFRTTVNVWGDSVGTGVIEYQEQTRPPRK